MSVRSIAVLTQFNLEPPIHWGVPNRTLDRDWLLFRLHLMERTSLPSLRSQTYKEFQWVIFLHPNSPLWLREEILQHGSDGIVRSIVEINGFDGIRYGSHLNHILDSSEWLTIKLDSDDLLSRDFVRLANENREPGNYCFEDGAYLDVESKRVFRRHYPNNPFPFRISQRGVSVLDEGHHVIRIDKRIRTNDPMWMQFHHGDNVSPEWKPMKTLRALRVSECFAFPESEQIVDPPCSPLARFLDFVARVWDRGFTFAGWFLSRVIRRIKRALRAGGA